MKWVMLALGVGFAIALAIEMPEIVRYVKIERM